MRAASCKLGVRQELINSKDSLLNDSLLRLCGLQDSFFVTGGTPLREKQTMYDDGARRRLYRHGASNT